MEEAVADASAAEAPAGAAEPYALHSGEPEVAATLDNPAQLTGWEMDVLRLIADGLRNAEIADRLKISCKTVDHHVSAVLGKLGVASRREAARAATRLLVVDPR